MKFSLDVNKLKPELKVTQRLKDSDLSDLQKLKPDLAKLRKLTPGLDDLKSMMSPDTEKLQKLSVALKDVQNRIPGIEDINSLTRRGGGIQKLIPYWGNDDEPESNSEDRAVAALSECEEKENYQRAQKILDAPQAKASLQSEIENLGDAAVTIQLSFERVANAFVDARNAAETQEQANDLSSFGESWSKYQQDWVKLLRLSQGIASRARLTATDFVENFLKVLADATVSLDVKKEKITAYQAKLKVGMDESRDLAQGFVELQNGIGNFYKSITDWMKQKNKLKEDILQLLADIKTTKESIQKLTSKAFLSATSALGLGSLAAGAVALGILCPLLWVGAAFSGVRAEQEGKAFFDNLWKKRRNSNDVQQKRKELDEKLLALEGLKRIQVILEPALSDLSVIGDKLWVISRIWSFIHADVVGIEKSLDMASKGAREALFKARLKTVTSVYSLLGEALSQYETAVNAVALGDESCVRSEARADQISTGYC
ncbi:hypothetical protein EDD15DRAFT_1645675 [Pisolithus albus]|nr:hypothetical protein EDD15DRAFT_1645675 [Pisolithus albus]